MLGFILLILAVVLFTIDKLIHGTKGAKLYDKIQGPGLLPVIGNAFDFFGGGVRIFYKGRQLANTFKGTYRLWIVQDPVLNLIDPDDIEVVLSNVKYIPKGFFYEFIRPWLKDGLLTSKGEKWHKRRKILTPTFHFNILKQFCQVFFEQSQKMVDRLKIEVGKEETEIQPYVTNFALNTICETAMGTNLDSTKKSVSEYKSGIFKMGEFVVYRISKVWLYSNFLFNLSSKGKEQKKVLSNLHNFTTNIIKERRNERNSTKADAEDKSGIFDEWSSKKRMVMLDLLLSAETEGKIDEDGIREEVDTFMFEGHDTTTMAITFCLMLFANNPEIQELAVAELNEIFGDSDRTTTMDDLNNMRYLERCIKEALRLYPSVPFIGRKLAEDLNLNNQFVPAGSTINIHVYDVHRRAELFPNPDKFDPDRFLPENTINRHPYAYIPFSAGPRNCIGQKFAILEEKSIISAVLRNYKLEPVTRPDDLIFTGDIVLRTINPVKVKFTHRKSEK